MSDISAEKLLSLIEDNFFKYIYFFILYGIIRGGLIYSLITFIIVLLAKIFVSTSVSLWYALVYWGFCGALGGALWGFVTAFYSLKNIKEAQSLELEAWKGIAYAGGKIGAVFGIIFAVLSNLLPWRPELGLNPIIIWILFFICGVFVGLSSSRVALRHFLLKGGLFMNVIDDE